MTSKLDSTFFSTIVQEKKEVFVLMDVSVSKNCNETETKTEMKLKRDETVSNRNQNRIGSARLSIFFSKPEASSTIFHNFHNLRTCQLTNIFIMLFDQAKFSMSWLDVRCTKLFKVAGPTRQCWLLR